MLIIAIVLFVLWWRLRKLIKSLESNHTFNRSIEKEIDDLEKYMNKEKHEDA